MTEIHMRKTLSGLEPADGFDMPRLKLGSVVKVKITQSRNMRHHRLFYRLMNTVFQNQEIYETLEDLVNMMKIATGHCAIYKRKNGEPIWVPRSIAFHNMDQTQFDDFFKRVIHVIREHVIPNIDEAALRAEVEEMVA